MLGCCQDLPSHAREWTAKEIVSRRCSQCEDTHHQRLWYSEPSGDMTWELVAGFCPVIFVHCVKLIASWNILCQIVKCGESDGLVGIVIVATVTSCGFDQLKGCIAHEDLQPCWLLEGDCHKAATLRSVSEENGSRIDLRSKLRAWSTKTSQKHHTSSSFWIYCFHTFSFCSGLCVWLNFMNLPESFGYVVESAIPCRRRRHCVCWSRLKSRRSMPRMEERTSDNLGSLGW